MPECAPMPDGRRDVREGTVAVVPVEDVGQGLVRVRVAVGPVALLRGPAHSVLLDAPDAVVDDEEIQVPVPVVVEPPRAHRPDLPAPGKLAGHPGGGGHVLEAPVAPVPVEDVPVDPRHVQVGPPVVVEIACGRTHRVPGAGDAGLGRHVLEHEPGTVAVEPVREAARRSSPAPGSSPRCRSRRPAGRRCRSRRGRPRRSWARSGTAPASRSCAPRGGRRRARRRPRTGSGPRRERRGRRRPPAGGPAASWPARRGQRPRCRSDSLMCSSPQARSPCS